MASRTERFPVAEGSPAVEVRNPAGTVDLQADDAASEFVVEVTPLDSAAEQVLDRVEIDAVGSRLRVTVPERRLFRSPSFAVRVTAPSGSAARVAVASAEATLRGTWAQVTLTSASGDAAVEACGELQLRTASGDARVGSVAGSAMLGAASADLRIDSVGGSLEARTASGDVSVGQAGAEVSVATASGDVDVDRVTSGSVRVRTVSGDISVGVEPDRRVWLDLSSTSGRMRSELTDEGGSAGTGPADVNLVLRSVSGDLRIRPVSLAS